MADWSRPLSNPKPKPVGWGKSVLDAPDDEQLRSNKELLEIVSNLIPAKLGAGAALGGLGIIKSAASTTARTNPNYLRWLLDNRPETLGALIRHPEGISENAANILSRLDRHVIANLKDNAVGVSSGQKDNIARAVDELGLDTLGYRGYDNTPAQVSRMEIRKKSPAHGFSEHTDLNPDANVANWFAGNKGTVVPVLMRTKGAYAVQDELANNPTGLVNMLGVAGHLPEKYARRGIHQPIPAEAALKAFADDGFIPSVVYPNTSEGVGAALGRLQNRTLMRDAVSLEDGLAISNPSAIPLDQRLYRFALETQGQPGKGYRKAEGGQVTAPQQPPRDLDWNPFD